MPTQPAENRINKQKLVGQIQSHTTLDTHLLHTEACLSASFGTQKSTMNIIRICLVYALIGMGSGEKDYTFQTARQVNFGIGFKE